MVECRDHDHGQKQAATARKESRLGRATCVRSQTERPCPAIYPPWAQPLITNYLESSDEYDIMHDIQASRQRELGASPSAPLCALPVRAWPNLARVRRCPTSPVPSRPDGNATARTRESKLSSHLERIKYCVGMKGSGSTRCALLFAFTRVYPGFMSCAASMFGARVSRTTIFASTRQLSLPTHNISHSRHSTRRPLSPLKPILRTLPHALAPKEQDSSAISKVTAMSHARTNSRAVDSAPAIRHRLA